MSWKPKKEKALTAEEALEIARKELAPFWFGSPPLLAPVRQGEATSVHPLDASFAQRSWLMAFFDPCSFAGEAGVALFREWEKRYNDTGIEVLLVLNPAFPSLYSTQSVQQLITAQKISFPVVADFQPGNHGALSAAFGADPLPLVLIVSGGGIHGRFSGARWYAEIERGLQKFIHLRDPGYPCLAPVSFKDAGAADISRTDFGARHLAGAAAFQFPAPFAPVQGVPLPVGRFQGPPDKKAGFGISGVWLQDSDRIITQDPTATISLPVNGERVSVIAQSLTAEKSARIAIEFNGITPHEAICSPGVENDDEGSAYVKIDRAGLHHALVELPAGERRVTLKFPQADRANVAIYSVLSGG